MAPRTGAAFVLRAGELLHVIDPEGEQVSDLLAYDAADPDHQLSAGRTIDYANRIYPRVGDTLYSNRSEPMLVIEADTAGRHDFLLTPCSQEMFAKLYGIHQARPSCFGNLAKNLAAFGIGPDQIPTTLNLFMNVVPDADTGELTIGTPHSGPGDSISLRAQRDLIIGLTACSAENSNNGTFKPIDFRIDAGGRPVAEDDVTLVPRRVPARAMQHVGLAVADFDRSMRFYREALGARRVLIFEEHGLKVAMLDLAGGCRLELFETPGGAAMGDAPGAAFDGRSAVPGALVHFAIASDDVPADHRRLLKAGARAASAPEHLRLSPPGQPDAGPMVHYSFVHGPDGELIELIAGDGI
jgi:uncharacterized protein YcgI (DUF1989 family)/catechol 2,3-dioxygenase-like lactoylglutathione lyase family enzyme